MTTPPASIDLLIEPEWIIPIQPHGVTLTDHAVAIKNGRIEAILPQTDARQRYAPAQFIKLPGQVLLPGFVNLHTHAAMSLLRGYADDLPLMRWLEDKMERFSFDQAAHILVNTQVSLDDYRAFYPQLPVDKFSLLRNFFDGELVSHGQHPGWDRFTLLHLGNFSRFRLADPLVRALARAVELGLPRDLVQVVSTGDYGSAALQLAEQLGVADLFRTEAPLPYHQIGAICQAADVLVYVAEPDADQRIASKFYDYLGARRPVLAVSDNPESQQLIDQVGAGAQFGHRDTEAMAQWLLRSFALGRHQTVERSLAGLTAAEASRTLAGVLARVTRKHA